MNCSNIEEHIFITLLGVGTGGLKYICITIHAIATGRLFPCTSDSKKGRVLAIFALRRSCSAYLLKIKPISGVQFK